jgi:GntR family transcriptional regulator, transcriptional repressor for pyruvate dehydrogenase complex
MSDDARAWQLVLRHIEAELAAGRLAPGHHLPPERALAAELGVGRSSVREAVRVLDVLGLVRTATGSGPSAGAIIVATPSGGMSTLMRLQLAATGFAVGDIVKTRLLLESTVAAELAGAARSGDSPALGDSLHLLDAMDAEGLPESEFLALDAQFHVSLALASDNEVIAAIMAGLRNSIEHYVLQSALVLPAWSTTAARLRAEHRGIVAAIAAGDAETAARLVRAHITGYYTETRLEASVRLPSTDPAPTDPAHESR